MGTTKYQPLTLGRSHIISSWTTKKIGLRLKEKHIQPWFCSCSPDPSCLLVEDGFCFQRWMIPNRWLFFQILQAPTYRIIQAYRWFLFVKKGISKRVFQKGDDFPRWFDQHTQEFKVGLEAANLYGFFRDTKGSICMIKTGMPILGTSCRLPLRFEVRTPGDW